MKIFPVKLKNKNSKRNLREFKINVERPMHSVEICNFLCHDLLYKIFEKFREINLVREEYSKMVLEITHLQSFGANLRKSCPNIPNSRRLDDFKSVKKLGIHWTRTELFQCKVAQLQSLFTDY